MKRETLKTLLGNDETNNSVWDNTIPIIRKGNNIDAYLYDAFGEAFDYAELYHTLRNAQEHETVTLHLSTPGGMVDTAFILIDAIRNTPAFVTANLVGSVASAGTMVALSCDDLRVADHTTFMIHNYSSGLVGKGHELKARQEFTDKSLNIAFKEFYSDFLTDVEMEEVIGGKDMWMGKDDIISRWVNKESMKYGKQFTAIGE